MRNEQQDILHLIDMIYTTLETAKSSAFSTDKCIVSRNQLLDVVEEIKARLPMEIKKAQDLIRARDEFVESAKREAESIKKKAELEAKTIVSESRILQAAREKSHEIVRRAEEKSQTMVQVTNEYTDDALRRTEEAIQLALQELQDARVRYRVVSNERMQEMRQRMDDGSENS